MSIDVIEGNEVWANKRTVARLLEIDPRTVNGLVRRGLIRCRELPGLRVTYSLSDAKRIREAAKVSCGA
jgi:predicted site-specific integrase-resolvase